LFSVPHFGSHVRDGGVPGQENNSDKDNIAKLQPCPGNLVMMRTAVDGAGSLPDISSLASYNVLYMKVQ
jgi:hypothetical protein